MIAVREHVPLHEHTTLGVGGPARYWFEAQTRPDVVAALEWAAERDVSLYVLGGGSNLLVADRGIDGLVLRCRIRGIEERRGEGDEVLVRVGAGVNWDELVANTVASDLAGLECLSGIPGDVGAAPMQNVGAYGQEVSHTIERVTAIERASGRCVELSSGECDFGYRDSIFKREAQNEYVIVGVDFALERGGEPTVKYPELDRALDGRGRTLAHVRDTVIALRRRKSMVLEPEDENRRSAGSFFVNPILSNDEADRVGAIAAKIAPGQRMPRYPAGDQAKLSAAWLIDRAGMVKGTQRGRVGISTRHSLAIVNLGGATAAELVAFAGEVRARVGDVFGVALTPEPRTIGFQPEELSTLTA